MSDEDKTTVQASEEQNKPKKAPRKRAKKTNGAAPTVDVWGIREGTARSKAAALYARAEGASLAEVKEVVGSVQYNVLTEMKAKGYTVTVTGGRGKQRYHLTK